MVKKVIFDAATGEILQWQDSSMFAYADPAAGTLDIAVNADQWALQDSLRWVLNGALSATAPAPNPIDDHAGLVVAALDAARIERQAIISILDGLQSSALAKADAATAAQIETAKQALRDITKVDLSACTSYADMKAAMLAAYKTIVAGASTSVQLAFAGALQ